MKDTMTSSEAKVLQVLVEHEEATAKTVYKTLAEETGWALATVVTFLRRLEAKGLVRHRKQQGERAFLYRPSRQGSAAGKRQLKEVLNRVFGGNPLPLVSMLLEEQALEPEQIDELRQLLDAHKKNGEQ
jgi:BlaI family transcriptional regulator, penicillinase repressor